MAVAITCKEHSTQNSLKYCIVRDCLRHKRYSNGYCTLHERQVRRNGEVTNNKVSELCLTEGCVYWAEVKGKCNYCNEKTRSKTERARIYRRAWSKKKRDGWTKEEKLLHNRRCVEYNLKSKYNLSLKDYERLLSKQNNECFLCKKLPMDKKLVVDHCHKTGKIRGLLCSSCNRGLGLLQDSPKILLKAYNYLKGTI